MEIQTKIYFNIKRTYLNTKQIQQFQCDSQTCLTWQQTFTVSENSLSALDTVLYSLARVLHIIWESLRILIIAPARLLFSSILAPAEDSDIIAVNTNNLM